MEFQGGIDPEKLKSAGFSDEEIDRLINTRNNANRHNIAEHLSDAEKNRLRFHAYLNGKTTEQIENQAAEDNPMSEEQARELLGFVKWSGTFVKENLPVNPLVQTWEFIDNTSQSKSITYTFSYKQESRRKDIFGNVLLDKYTIKLISGGAADGVLVVNKRCDYSEDDETLRLQSDGSFSYTPPQVWNDGQPFEVNEGNAASFEPEVYQRAASMLIPYIDIHGTVIRNN